MKDRRSMYEIRSALEGEIAEALDESYLSLRVEILGVNAREGIYSVKGTFKVIPLLSNIVKRKGKFEAELDEHLKIISLNITEER